MATPLEDAIANVYRELNRHTILSDEYAKTFDYLTKLHALRDTEKSKSVSKDTLVVVGANLLGILMIIKHENVNVITSRAMGLLMKPR